MESQTIFILLGKKFASKIGISKLARVFPVYNTRYLRGLTVQHPPLTRATGALTKASELRAEYHTQTRLQCCHIISWAKKVQILVFFL